LLTLRFRPTYGRQAGLLCSNTMQEGL
jgi:hypothetical protein